MSNVLIFGAGPSDTIKLLSGGNPATPVGGQAHNPLQLQVLAPDRATPVSGASVFLPASPPVGFSVCGGAPSCTVLSDENGQVVSNVTVLSAGVITITALVAPASYSNRKSVQSTLLGASSTLDISLLSPTVWVAQGATLDLPTKARVLSNGRPLVGSTLGYQVVSGAATPTSTAAVTDNDGFATTILHIAALAGEIQISFFAPLTIQGTASAGGEALSFELRSFGAATSSASLRLLNLSDFVKKQSRSVSLSGPPNTHSEKPSPATSEFRLHLTK